MNRIELQDNDFPFTAKSVRFMQETCSEAIKNLARVYGNNYILWGCDLVNGYRTEGVIVINGEVIPFVQSPANDKIKIEETTENVTYKGGLTLPAYYTRVAKCDSMGMHYFSNFKKVIPNKPAATDWQEVIFMGGYDEKATRGSHARIDDEGKCLIQAYYERIDGINDPYYNDQNNNMGAKIEILQLPNNIRPSSKQSIDIHPYYFSILLPPVFGYVDTNGVVGFEYRIQGQSFQAYNDGVIHARIDLV